MTAAEKTARALAAIPTLSLPVGTFVATNTDGTVQIDFGDGAVTCLTAGSFQPLPGVSVRCLQTDVGTVLLGPASPRSSYGTVTATGSTTVTVTVGAETLQLPFDVGYTPRTIGDVVHIDWGAGGIVIDKVSAVPSSSYLPPASSVKPYQADFRANDSGSYQSGSWNKTDVWCSDTNIGAWFYGTTIASTIPDGATITKVQVYIDEFYNQFPTSLATIGLHSLTGKAGAPAVSSAVTISAGSGWKTLPNSLGDALKTGARRGVGTNHGGFHKFRSRASDADSGLLRINWSV